jgi:hypothetical protein
MTFRALFQGRERPKRESLIDGIVAGMTVQILEEKAKVWREDQLMQLHRRYAEYG